MEILESVAHLERTTPNAYAHQFLVEHLSVVAKNRRVQSDLENRAAYDSDAALTTSIRKPTGNVSRR